MALLSQEEVSQSCPRVPRDSFARHGHIFCARIWTVYAVNILLASSRMLIAAYDLYPSHFHTHSDRLFRIISVLSFILPRLQRFLLEGKKRSTFTFSFLSMPVYSLTFSEHSISIILYTFRNADTAPFNAFISIFPATAS